MNLATSFGPLHVPHSVSSERVNAVKRALQWCDAITEGTSLWQRNTVEKHVVVERFVNGARVTLSPILAARQDFGDDKTGFSRHHLPVTVNDRPICVVPKRGILERNKSLLLHTDLVASLLLLLGSEDPPLEELPKTLGKVLYPKAFPGGRFDIFFSPERQRLHERFHDEVGNEEEAMAFFGALDERSWVHCLPLLDPHTYPECARFHAERIVSRGIERRNGINIVWALDIIHTLDPEHYNERLPIFMSHPAEDVAQYAIENYQAVDSEDAWGAFSPLLGHPYNESFWDIIIRLLEFPDLQESLLDRCELLLKESEDHEFRTKILSFMSNYRNMDDPIRLMIGELQPHELPTFVFEIKTYGAWFEEIAFEWIESGRSRLNRSIVEASMANTSFDRFPLWEKLMHSSSGAVRTALMPHLAHVGTDQAFRLIESQTNHELRFVSRRAYVWVASFKRHPRTGDVLLQGMESQYKGVRLECQRLLQLRRDEGLDP